MISYLIQALATFVFGPMLSTILVICDPDRFQPPYFRLSRQHWLAQIGVNLAGSIHRTNILIALSILLSATIRIQQVAPLAEVQFLDTLALYELYLAYSSMFLSLPISPTALKGWGSLAVYYFIILVLMFRMTFMRKFPNQNSTAMEEITRHCAIQKDYHLPDFISTTRTEEDPQLRRLQTRLKVLVPIGMILLVGLVALKWLRRPILKLYMRLSVPFKLLRNPFSSLGRLYLELCSFIRIDKNLLLIVAACVTMSGVWMFFAISTAQTLQNQRILMQKLSGDAYQDNQWGFGQIMAVLVWAQFVEQLVHAIFCKRRRDTLTKTHHISNLIAISKHVYKHRRVRQQDRVLAETAAFRISSPPHEANIADHTIASISEEAGPLTEDYTSIAPNFSQQTIPTQQWNETDVSSPRSFWVYYTHL